MNTPHADLVLQYVLAAAGERAGSDREVTTTQLVKYAYLADLAHANRHGGTTFTQAPWRFELLGPHAEELADRIEPVARRIGASSRGAALLLDDDDLGHRRAAELELPAVVTSAIMQALRAFTRDTNALLAHVYATTPMRRAAPGALIDFSPDPAPEASQPAPPPRPIARGRRTLRAPEVTAALAYPPRYDGVFDDGHRALDAAETAVRACQGALSIDDAVWTAAGRGERDVP